MNHTGTDLQLGSDSIKKAYPSQGLQDMTNEQKCWKHLHSDDKGGADQANIAHINKTETD